MMQQIKMSEAIGKTLKTTVTGVCDAEYILVFDDNTFTVLGIDRDDDQVREVTLDLALFDVEALIAAGIVTKPERDALWDAHVEAERQKNEDWSRRQYERLKARFEPQ